MTDVIKKAAKTSPTAAHTIDKVTPELSRLRARRVMSTFRDKAHDFMKNYRAGKGYLTQREY